MVLGLDFETLALGLFIFFARITDVALGTLRTINVIHGRTKVAFFLGFVEITLWLSVIAVIVPIVASRPVLGFFFALGFSTGNVVGIMVERRIALGSVLARIISSRHGKKMAQKVRRSGYAVTTFDGKGTKGPVTMLFVVCRRKELKDLLSIIRGVDTDAFYTTEIVGEVSKVHDLIQSPTGWRSVLKKK